MKIAVYAICKNEEKFIDNWYDSIKEADGVFVTDTGSTDETVEKLKEKGVNVFHAEVEPWRFDVARNIALENVPEDYDVCLCIDMDEVMEKGWKEKVEKVFEIQPKTTMIRYPFVYSWLDDEQTQPKTTMYQFKIHTRHGYHWEYPIHEILEWHGEGETLTVYCEDIKSYHYRDRSKKRTYDVMIDDALREAPDDPRLLWLRTRELMINNRFDEVEEQAREMLEKTKFAIYNNDYLDISQYRALCMRYTAQSLMQLHKKDKTVDAGDVLEWMLRSVGECPWIRESWVALAQTWALFDRWEMVYACAKFAQTIKARSNSIENDERCWGEYPKKLQKMAWKQLQKEEKNESENNSEKVKS